MEHPECTYNLVNCPYLRPAYLLDYILYNFSVEVSKGLWEFSGVPVIVNSEEHLKVSFIILFNYVYNYLGSPIFKSIKYQYF